jgi:hypothetical protein
MKTKSIRNLILAAVVVLNVLALPSHAQTPTVGTTYTFTGITQANLAAAITTASTETPSSGSLANLNVNKNPATGLFNVTAIYR